jgi:hypothetical protein
MRQSNKPLQSNKIFGLFHGIDPATKNDYYTDVIHVLYEKPKSIAHKDASEFNWNPFLVKIARIKQKNLDPNEILDMQIRIFNRYPPTYVTIDATREEFLSAALIRKYGQSRIKALKFSNSGTSNTKFGLKQLGYAYIKGGYEWPDIYRLEKTHPRYAKLIRILKKEMMSEQVEYTENGRITFNHPIGKHNDLVHAWEMSLDAVMQFQKKNLGFQKITYQDNNLDDPIARHYRNDAKKQDDDEEDPVLARCSAFRFVDYPIPRSSAFSLKE